MPSPRPAGRTNETLDAAHRRLDDVQAALEASEARFRNVVEHNGDAIVVVADDGAIRYANVAAGPFFGAAPNALIGRPFGFPMTTGETTELDVLVNGSARVAEMRVTESMWDGEPVRLALLRDITDLETMRNERSAQVALHLAEARLREMVSQAPVAIAVVRGNEHRYDITNARYDELVGYRKVIGKSIREALPELEGQGIYELMDQVYTTGEPYVGRDLKLMIERRPGVVEEAFFSFVYQPLRESDGAVTAIAIVATDVTAHVRARQEVELANERLQAQAKQLEEQTTEAETANRSKSDFLATMSHELRTPLNAIGGYADLMLAEIRGPITEAQRVDLERINRNQRHLLSVINDILNFAKVEAGQFKLNMAEVSMNEVLGELEALVTPMLIAKRIAYDYRCCDPHYKAYADPERLQQVLLNLLSNAAKFTNPDGQITVECGATKTSMHVRVQDTGVGIPEDKLQSIFEPFVQLDRGQHPGMGGTGLGLAISRDLARAMGGELSAESTPRKGSTFLLTLPRVKQEARRN